MSCNCAATPKGVLIYKSYPSLQRILARNPQLRDYLLVWVRRADRLRDIEDTADVMVDTTIPEYEWATYAKLQALDLVDRTGAQICHVS